MRLPLEAARNWGGARKGAGRKPRGRPSMPHVTRPKIDPRYPVQVAVRATPGLPSLRWPRVFGALRQAIARASVDRFRAIHFSIQQDHGHFIVEGDEPRRARGGMHRAGVTNKCHPCAQAILLPMCPAKHRPSARARQT